MKYIWLLDTEMWLKIYELARQHGKKPGDSVEAEFRELREKYPEAFECLGELPKDKDIDTLTGDLREEGIKVLNLAEEERKRKNKGL